MEEEIIIKYKVDDDIVRKAKWAVEHKLALDLKNDAVFKSFFSKDTVESKYCLCSFISSVINQNVVEAKVLNPEILPEYIQAKIPRMDIRCKLDTGEEVDVEMQKANIDDQKKRSLFYASKLYASNLEAGEDYRDITPVHQIMVTDFIAFHDEKLHHKFTMKDEPIYDSTKEKIDFNELTDSMQVHFVELPKLSDIWKKERISLSKLEFWASLIAYNVDDDIKEKLVNGAEYREEMLMAEKLICNMTKTQKEWEMQYGYEKYITDYFAYITAATRKGYAEGMQQGMQQGIENLANLLKAGISLDEALKQLNQ